MTDNQEEQKVEQPTVDNVEETNESSAISEFLLGLYEKLKAKQEAVYEWAQESLLQKIMFWVLCASIAAVYIFIISCLGYFGMDGPDPKSAFYIKGVNVPSLTRDGASALANERGVEIASGYPVDMGHIFRAWFLWGFWAQMLQVIFMLCHISYFFLIEGFALLEKPAFMMVQAVIALNNTIWFFTGLFCQTIKNDNCVPFIRLLNCEIIMFLT